MLNAEIRNLMFDCASRREIYDEAQDRMISKQEANDKIREVVFEELGLSKNSTDKEIKRALKRDSAYALFEVIEELVDIQIATGLGENSFVQQFVETRNIKDGDHNEFYVENEVLLNVAKVAGDHHDLEYCRVRIAQAV